MTEKKRKAYQEKPDAQINELKAQIVLLMAEAKVEHNAAIQALPPLLSYKIIKEFN
jgi:hypothetical protein